MATGYHDFGLFEWRNGISKRSSILLSALMLLGILVFGLNPKGFYISNNVRWIDDQNGIRFGKYGIAYTNSPFDAFASHSHTPSSLSVEIALKPDGINHGGFQFVLVLHSGEDAKQLLIGQWLSWLIVMNGDDYDGSQRTKRISVRDVFLPQKIRFVTLTSGEEGTNIYLDGKIAKTKKDLVLQIPDGREKPSLVVGNSVYGRDPWTGDIYALALYGYELTAKDIELHFKRWSKQRDFSFAKEHTPKMLYIFDEKGGEKAFDQSGEKHHLEIPSRVRILRREILVAPWYGLELNKSFVQDIILNIIGFIPFGFFLNAMFFNIGGFIEKHSFLITVFLCLVISLFIEIAQAWMPSRSSQMLDVMSNMLGASLGAILYRAYLRFLPKPTRQSC